MTQKWHCAMYSSILSVLERCPKNRIFRCLSGGPIIRKICLENGLSILRGGGGGGPGGGTPREMQHHLNPKMGVGGTDSYTLTAW